MTNSRIHRAPIFYLGIAAGLVIAALIWAFMPQGDPQAAAQGTVRHFDKNVQLAASSGISLTFTKKTGFCSAQKCGKFSGRVTSSDPRCVSGRTVTITGPGGFSTTVITNSDGKYETPQRTGLASGTYTATVSASGGYGFTCDSASTTTTV